jgi:DNA-binding response OmpR family regulator/DNA-binding CsgD family transcriptional regulator
VTALILIVDDDHATRGMLEQFAAAERFAATSAASGVEALQRLDNCRPDLILLDAVMEGIDGFETCRRIKAREDAAHIPVIFMTGLSETQHVVAGLSAGGVDYVTKPVVLDELAARIRVHLANARTTRGALSALGSVGARLLACDTAGRIGWATGEAERLLDAMDPGSAERLHETLRSLTADDAKTAMTFPYANEKLALTRLGPVSEGRILVRLSRSTEGRETQVLKDAFGLTPREADVLLWTAHGKSNKDMSEILNISARTVNKHLEQIFLKIGVENRTSAGSAATRVLLSQS